MGLLAYCFGLELLFWGYFGGWTWCLVIGFGLVLLFCCFRCGFGCLLLLFCFMF